MTGGEPVQWQTSVKLQLNTHLRHSADTQFPVKVPAGGALTSVDPGTHLELSRFTLKGSLSYSHSFRAFARLDAYDLHQRNPTDTDDGLNVHEYWIRMGPAYGSRDIPDQAGGYVRVGKFHKFERQPDRHLESYGLAGTAFNRTQDQGIELGADLGPHLYLRYSLTSGNPVFLRDPNALAGDMGTGRQLTGRSSSYGTGIPLLYDAEVEDFEWDQDSAENGVGLGYKLGDETGSRVFNILFHYYDRDLQKQTNITGAELDADLAALSGPDAPLKGLHGKGKEEYGATAWIYFDHYALFAQYIEQDIGGLERTGWEAEVSRRFFLPELSSLAGQPLFSTFEPALRVSRLDPHFAGPPNYFAPSVSWEWTKVDVGFRTQLHPAVLLTTEYAFNEFERAGKQENNNEFLLTLHWERSF